MPRSRRHLLALCAAGVLSTLAASPACAQDSYPSRPIHIVVPYAAGGTTDQVARAIQPAMQEFLSSPWSSTTRSARAA